MLLFLASNNRASTVPTLKRSLPSSVLSKAKSKQAQQQSKLHNMIFQSGVLVLCCLAVVAVQSNPAGCSGTGTARKMLDDLHKQAPAQAANIRGLIATTAPQANGIASLHHWPAGAGQRYGTPTSSSSRSRSGRLQHQPLIIYGPNNSVTSSHFKAGLLPNMSRLTAVRAHAGALPLDNVLRLRHHMTLQQAERAVLHPSPELRSECMRDQMTRTVHQLLG